MKLKITVHSSKSISSRLPLDLVQGRRQEAGLFSFVAYQHLSFHCLLFKGTPFVPNLKQLFSYLYLDEGKEKGTMI